MGDSYIAENRSFVTASKLKNFIESPENYFLTYIKEVPSLKTGTATHFLLGCAIDDWISYGKVEFNKKYARKKKLLKPYLLETLDMIGVDTIGLSVKQLEEVYYENDKKVYLTTGEMETVMGCVGELERQPLFDKDGDYICQKTFYSEYKGLKLKGTLDRYLPSKELEDGTKTVAEVRDTKSTKSISSFMWDWKEKLHYDISMSFYYLLSVGATKDIPVVKFDVVQKTFPYPSRIIELPSQMILDTIKTDIIPALDRLAKVTKEYEETGDESLWLTKKPLNNLVGCDMYPIMETSLQKEIEYLQ